MNTNLSIASTRQRGSVLIEGALFLAVLAILVAGAISLLLHLKFEVSTYEALRKSASELTAWKPAGGAYLPDEISREMQCQSLKEIVSDKLQKAGLSPDDFQIIVREQSSDMNIEMRHQEIAILSNGTNSVLDRFLRDREITFSYIPSRSTTVTNCSRHGQGGYGSGDMP